MQQAAFFLPPPATNPSIPSSPASTVNSTDDVLRKKAIVVGAGPVGCLAALSLANAGWIVGLYEGRPDIRLESSRLNIAQRSINLAISSRGIAALYAVDPAMATRFLESAIPMRGRMIHDEAGNQESQVYDPQGGQCINSLERGILNEELLDQAAAHSSITIHFQHKLATADFDKKVASFSATTSEGKVQTVEATFDFCVGADGSYSNVRRQMMRVVRMDYQQEYIPHEYIELRMPPGPEVNGSATFLIDPNHLHIWPRHSFMLIALPNKDKSFTCTLFAPKDDLARLDRPHTILTWFRKHFPDALELIGEDTLLDDFARNPKSSLISIKARPYHYRDRAIIIGDAAHSMVPFYGQGLNCGLEDVRILQTIFSARGIDGYSNSKKPKVHFEANGEADVDKALEAALEEYSRTRYGDLTAISELAMNNYVEMRHDVTTPLYRILKAIDTLLASVTASVPFNSLAPVLARVSYPRIPARGWIPLYTMVTFRPDISYGAARERAAWQSRVLRTTGWTTLSLASAIGGMAVWWGINRQRLFL
ncbi:kynurenine 3-monooxygenase, mitochondrial precursor [Tulasnella sp. 424]|nr:kynurenine 3-monooxygenase, mitochondrial precursor [Tulasnella sp. 424]KAG8978470.1 kynurenine 3-monooxygenase, mitochondrial precursor [Tulasnella sp. 425]